MFKQTLDPMKSHYRFLPPYLLVDALQHFKTQQVSYGNHLKHLIKVHLQVTAVIVTPIWPGSSFYNVFWPDVRHTAPFVTNMIVTQPFFICGPLVNRNGMRGRRPYKTAITLVNFKQNAPKQYPPAAAGAFKEAVRGAGLSCSLLPIVT